MRNREDILKVLIYDSQFLPILSLKVHIVMLARDQCSTKQYAGNQVHVHTKRVVVPDRIHSRHILTVGYDPWIVSEHYLEIKIFSLNLDRRRMENIYALPY